MAAAVEQRIGGSRLFLGGRFALGLLHLHAACRHGQRNNRAALGVGEHALVVFLGLLGKEGAEFSRVYAAVAALKMQRVVLVRAGQLCVKFLFAGNDRVQSACTKKSRFLVSRAEMPASSSLSFAESPFCMNVTTFIVMFFVLV